MMEPSVERMNASALSFAKNLVDMERRTNQSQIDLGIKAIPDEQLDHMQKSIETIYCRGYIDGMADAVTQYEADQPPISGAV